MLIEKCCKPQVSDKPIRILQYFNIYLYNILYIVLCIIFLKNIIQRTIYNILYKYILKYWTQK